MYKSIKRLVSKETVVTVVLRRTRIQSCDNPAHLYTEVEPDCSLIKRLLYTLFSFYKNLFFIRTFRLRLTKILRTY